MAQSASAKRPGFNFTHHLRLLCSEMVAHVPALAHIDMARVCVMFAQVRVAGPYGVQGRLTPLRFEQGASETIRRGRRYRIQSVCDESGREQLYLATFYLPRFQDLPISEKIVTVLHELWHIGPAFDGDLRRFPGRCFAHGRSQAEYDRQVDELVAAWQATNPPESSYAFLKLSFAELCQQYGGVFGNRYRRPRLLPIAANGELSARPARR